jgi:peptidoglycan/LPS O-acetylase OafA/YrhL
MALILSEKYTSYKLFIKNRILRIYPAYLLVFVLSLILLIILKQMTSFYFWEMIHNIFIIGINNFSLNPNNGGGLLVFQAWTLSVEMLFYLIAPILVKRNIKTLILVGGISGLIKYFVYHWQIIHHVQPMDVFFPGELVFFILGIISYRIYRLIQGINKKYLYVIYFCILACSIFYSFIPFTLQYKWLVFKDWSYLFSLTAAIPFVFALCKKWRFDRFLGELSYPLYLIHPLALTVVVTLVGNRFYSPAVSVYLYALLAVLGATGIYFFIDKPIDKLRQKSLAKQ